MCDAAQLSIVSKNASISLLNGKSAIEHGAFPADLLGNQAVGPAPTRGWAHAPTIARCMDPLDYSRYARQLVAARPELREELERAKDSGWTREAMQAFLRERGGGDEGALHSGLRRLRQRVLLRTMARDLSGKASLDEVCGAMSALAEVAIETSLEFLEPSEQAGVLEPRARLFVVGMGKLGGGELNVSSDVDHEEP